MCQNFQLRRQSARLQDLARSLRQIHRKLDSRSRSEVFSVWIDSPMFPIDPKIPFQEYTILGMGSKKPTWVGLKDVSKHIHLPLTMFVVTRIFNYTKRMMIPNYKRKVHLRPLALARFSAFTRCQCHGDFLHQACCGGDVMVIWIGYVMLFNQPTTWHYFENMLIILSVSRLGEVRTASEGESNDLNPIGDGSHGPSLFVPSLPFFDVHPSS